MLFSEAEDAQPSYLINLVLTLMYHYGHFCLFGQIFPLHLAIILAVIVHMAQFFVSPDKV